MVEEVVTGLRLKANDKVIDCTFGRGGHTREFLKATTPSGRVLAIDTDERAFAEGLSEMNQEDRARVIPVPDNFRNLTDVAARAGWSEADAVFLDLGVSSPMFDDPSYGLSFRGEAPLDMRFNKKIQTLTAAEIVNRWPEKQIQTILKDFADEFRALALARAIVEKRRTKEIKTTADLVEIIQSVYRGRGGKIHPATKTFQALRMAVNDELGALEAVLPQAIQLLKSGGRLGILSFHSKEDRLVKLFLRECERAEEIRRLHKHVIRATRAECLSNPRSRSAKLRLIEKL